MLRLSQSGFVEKRLRDFNMWESKPVATPMDLSKLEQADEGYQAQPSLKALYQAAVGSLMYAMLGTCPDLAYAVSLVSRFAFNPTELHYSAVKRIFRYLRGIVNMQLVFRGDLERLTGYSDAD